MKKITQITYPNSSTNTFSYNALDTRVGKVDSGRVQGSGCRVQGPRPPVAS